MRKAVELENGETVEVVTLNLFQVEEVMELEKAGSPADFPSSFLACWHGINNARGNEIQATELKKKLDVFSLGRVRQAVLEVSGLATGEAPAVP